jgi:hypothetical protein
VIAFANLQAQATESCVEPRPIGEKLDSYREKAVSYRYRSSLACKYRHHSISVSLCVCVLAFERYDKERAARNAREVSSSMERTRTVMATELERSADALLAFTKSTDTLRSTRDQYATLSAALKKGEAALRQVCASNLSIPRTSTWHFRYD